MPTGKELFLGGANGAESTTNLSADRALEAPGIPRFIGNFILEVKTGAFDTDHADPDVAVGAILGSAHNLAILGVSAPGVGVYGQGSSHGDGMDQSPAVGIGVVGNAGDGNPVNRSPPNIGVLGLGGKGDDAYVRGPGVVGLAGASDTTDLYFDRGDFGGAGVYGGGSATSRLRVEGDPASGYMGATRPGTGVVGMGGTDQGINPSGRGGGAGVIGLAGNRPDPPNPSESIWSAPDVRGTGVYGHGSTGVVGLGEDGAGVVGKSAETCGAILFGGGAAQLRLDPDSAITVRVTRSDLTAGTVWTEPDLPIQGKEGDILVAKVLPRKDDVRVHFGMWLCVIADDVASRRPAHWLPVLLGPDPVKGTIDVTNPPPIIRDL